MKKLFLKILKFILVNWFKILILIFILLFYLQFVQLIDVISLSKYTKINL